MPDKTVLVVLTSMIEDEEIVVSVFAPANFLYVSDLNGCTLSYAERFLHSDGWTKLATETQTNHAVHNEESFKTHAKYFFEETTETGKMLKRFQVDQQLRRLTQSKRANIHNELLAYLHRQAQFMQIKRENLRNGRLASIGLIIALALVVILLIAALAFYLSQLGVTNTRL